ncbi:MAG: BadF/BadG/BcrA/BcrD ATPase family protein [Actinomycetota bacterium]
MKYVLGVDGGATKTTAGISDINENMLSQYVAGASNYHSVGIDKARENLNEAVFSAIGDAGLDNVEFASSCFGFAGYNTAHDRKYYERIVFNKKLKALLKADKVLIYNDTRVGLAAGSDCQDKLILIAGTGSNCYGLNREGREAKSNGWDYILADEGSGYSIGLKALRAVMRAYDGRGEKTLLSEAIFKEIGAESIADLISWTYQEPFSKDRIGALSITVCDTAKKGDRISQDILAQEAKEAEISVNAVVDKLGLEDKKFDLVLVGGNFKCEKYFKAVLTRNLKARYKKINFLPPTHDPVFGAVKLAIENL